MISFIMKGYPIMKTRVEKYFDDGDNAPRRTQKNNELYEEIKHSDISGFNSFSNAKVIGDQNSQIDVDKIKEILEKNYQEPPKRRVLTIEDDESTETELEATKEYDINAILDKARLEKEIDYENERLKKIRDTQYDILKSLEVDKENTTKSSTEKTKEELMELINTININEQMTKEIKSEETKGLDPLDLLSDLKGDENTIVAGAKELDEERKKIEESENNKQKESEIDKSFYTNSMSFNKKDFDDSFLDDENHFSSIIIKILIFLIFIAIIAGIVIFVNDFLNLGLF